MEQVLQLLGAVLILVAFIGAQTQRLAGASLPNLVLGFLLLETVWAIVSGWGLLHRVPT